MYVTIIIIVITALMSLAAFQSADLMDRWIMRPYLVRHNNQWYRFITSGLIHANWPHLFVNMLVFYSFAGVVFAYYDAYFANKAVYYFLILYFGGMVIADLPTYMKHQNDPGYASLGASGAVSAITFAFVLMEPRETLYVMGVLPVPAIVFGVLYLLYTQYAAKRGGDNINHSAHFYGAVFGIVFTILLRPNFAVDFVHKLLGR